MNLLTPKNPGCSENSAHKEGGYFQISLIEAGPTLKLKSIADMINILLIVNLN